MAKRMYRDTRTGATFKTINGHVVKIHSGKDLHHHVNAHDMEPTLKAGDGKREKDIIRFYSNPNKNYRVMQRGVSKRQAWLHTNDPSTRKEGVYFDAMAKADDY